MDVLFRTSDFAMVAAAPEVQTAADIECAPLRELAQSMAAGGTQLDGDRTISRAGSAAGDLGWSLLVFSGTAADSIGLMTTQGLPAAHKTQRQ
jgi:hypothetical protein